jgi:hypothetical protein
MRIKASQKTLPVVIWSGRCKRNQWAAKSFGTSRVKSSSWHCPYNDDFSIAFGHVPAAMNRYYSYFSVMLRPDYFTYSHLIQNHLL